MSKKAKEISEAESEILYQNICNEIILAIEDVKDRGNFIGDIGNAIGFAISKHTCKNGKDLNLLDYSEKVFIDGVRHGFSLNDGTHNL